MIGLMDPNTKQQMITIVFDCGKKSSLDLKKQKH